MSLIVRRQLLSPTLTSWHITWGTYGTRLHGAACPTVDRDHNQRGEAFIQRDAVREQAEQRILNFPACCLTDEQRAFVEQQLPQTCARGRWDYRICAAAEDHVHVLCDIPPAIHGEKVRRLLKRWLGQDMSKLWPIHEGATWWAEEGSNIAVEDEAYLNNVFKYILRQRTTPFKP
jgi:REP element-mobilizing transposase RayT